MTKEQQDLLWSLIPKEIREEIHKKYEVKESSDILEDLFGPHNLTSYSEPPKTLSLLRKRIQDLYAGYVREISELPVSREDEPKLTIINRTSLEARKSLLEELYTKDECLKMITDSLLTSDSKIYPKFHENDMVTVNDWKNKPYQGIIQEVVRGVKGFIYKIRGSEEYIPEECMEKYPKETPKEETLLDKYWVNGNIFEFNTGERRMIWEDKAITQTGFTLKQKFNNNLVNSDRYVIRVYSPNNKANILSDLVSTSPDRLLWERSEYIITEKDLKNKLGIPKDKILIITKS